MLKSTYHATVLKMPAYRITCTLLKTSPKYLMGSPVPENLILDLAKKIRPLDRMSAPQVPEHVVILSWDEPLSSAEIDRLKASAAECNAELSIELEP